MTSTQDEADRRLGEGTPLPFVITAREQSRGRGRLGRRFESPDGGSLSLTFAHRSALEPGARTWFPLAAGLAAIDALTAVVGSDGPRLGLKWPNDIHTEDGRKLGGILVEGRGAHTVLLGIGVNLRGPVREAGGTAVPGAAWLLGEDGIGPGIGDEAVDEVARAEALREQIEDTLAAALARELEALESTGGDATAAGTARRYTMTCLTVGRVVQVHPLGEIDAGGVRPPSLHGIARAIDGHGRLVVDLEGGDQVAVDVGDVRHVRPGGPARPATDAARGVDQEEHGL